MYVTLRRGDRLPAVTAVQWMLNRSGAVAPIVVDGDYGSETARAVEQFQLQRGLDPSGIVDTDTWNDLAAIVECETIEAIDGGDIDMWLTEVAYLGSGGSTMVSTFGMSMGVPVALERIRRSARAGRVLVLRFDGHGRPGHMGISIGDAPATHADSILAAEALSPPVRAFLASLRPIFSGCGSIELHRCSTGLGSKGRRLLRGMADSCGVPVTAGLRSQYGGRRADRFEGPTLTICPGDRSLAAWSARFSD